MRPAKRQTTKPVKTKPKVPSRKNRKPRALKANAMHAFLQTRIPKQEREILADFARKQGISMSELQRRAFTAMISAILAVQQNSDEQESNKLVSL